MLLICNKGRQLGGIRSSEMFYVYAILLCFYAIVASVLGPYKRLIATVTTFDTMCCWTVTKATSSQLGGIRSSTKLYWSL